MREKTLHRLGDRRKVRVSARTRVSNSGERREVCIKVALINNNNNKKKTQRDREEKLVSFFVTVENGRNSIRRGNIVRL